MITEDYCSYEVAKLLKDKGFDGLCYCHEFTDYEGNFTTYHTEYPENWNQSEPCVSIPTLGMAMKWLREVHLLHIYAEYKAFFQERPKKLYYHWMPFIKPLPKCKYQTPQNKVCFDLDEYCNSYEEAVEAALKYSLENLI